MNGHGPISLFAVLTPDSASSTTTTTTATNAGTHPNTSTTTTTTTTSDTSTPPHLSSACQPTPPSDAYLLSPTSASAPFAAVLANRPLLASLALDCQSYAAATGLIMYDRHHRLIHAPHTLLPSPIPRSSYSLAQSLSPLYSTLYDRISRDYDFLVQHLTLPAAADEFLASLLSILHTVQAEGQRQPLRLHLHRSDYMLHVPATTSTPQLLQVEYNTIAASFAALATKTAALHRYLCTRHMPEQVPIAFLPPNRAYHQLAHAIARAFSAYKAAHSAVIAGRRLIACMVVQGGEANAIDQKLLEYDLFEQHAVAIVRLTLSDLHHRAALDPHGQLTVGDCIIAVTYFRAGYTPRDFPGEEQWRALLKVERSLSIKCPSVASHLSGSKKIQQVLTLPGVVERYLPAEAAAQLRLTFAGMWGMDADDDATRAAIADALADPSEYVLKPQREGGGNNLWEEEMVRVLRGAEGEGEGGASVSKRAQYILMRRIHAPEFETAFVREGEEVRVGRGLSELGVYSAMLSDGESVEFSECCGHLVRTKQVGVKEGGVAAGFACLDSPILT